MKKDQSRELFVLEQIKNKMEAMSKYFVLDKEESFCQCGIYRKVKRHGMNHVFKKEIYE